MSCYVYKILLPSLCKHIFNKSSRGSVEVSAFHFFKIREKISTHSFLTGETLSVLTLAIAPWRVGWSPESNWTSTRRQNPNQWFSEEKSTVLSLVNVAKKSLLSSKLDELQAKETYNSLKISLQASSMPISKTLQIFLHFLSTTRCFYRSENLLTYSKKKSKKQQSLL